jgi:WD40 repeat protein
MSVTIDMAYTSQKTRIFVNTAVRTRNLKINILICCFVSDQSGKVRIWDTVNKEHLLKNEFQPIGGLIKDIAWSPDSQRMVVVGEGRER